MLNFFSAIERWRICNLSELRDDFYIDTALLCSFAKQMNAPIYKVFIPKLIVLICRPRRFCLCATCFLSHADFDISKLTLLFTEIPV
jgi:hypothetical protein